MTRDQIVVVGGGTMGRGIGLAAAMAGIRTTVCDLQAHALIEARAFVDSQLFKAVQRGKMSEADASAARQSISYAADATEPLAQATWVIEAVPEDVALKKRVLCAAAEVVGPDTLVATNTSSLSIEQLADGVPGPHRVLGMHFFNPAHRLPLVEIVRHTLVAEEAVAGATDLARRLGKTPIVVQDSPGFASSRLGLALGLEAIRMVEAGVASAEDIDTAMELGYRHPMGPLKVTDLVGLDVRLAIAEHLATELGSRFEPPELLRSMVADGRLGRKAGRGFYEYPEH